MQFIQLPSEKLIQGGLNKVNNFYPFDLLGILPDNHKKLIFRWFNNLLGIFRYKRKWPNNLVPYFGSQWWGLSREAVEYFLNYIESHKDIFLFFRYSWAPDELLIQTILGNSPLRRSIINRTFRYIDWTNTSTGSPKTLTLQDDYKKLLASEEIFARKFNLNFDSEIIEKLKECF
jgi:hypothetical protein